MRKQKSMGNKGFSLVELIIVIAIMAILIGVMAPQLIRYIERTRVSADTQLADTIRTAVQTAMMDPMVLDDPASAAAIATLAAAATPTDLVAVMTTACVFTDTIAVTLGEAAHGDITQAWVTGNLRSTPTAPAVPMTITVQIINNNAVQVAVVGGAPITVG